MGCFVAAGCRASCLQLALTLLWQYPTPCSPFLQLLLSVSEALGDADPAAVLQDGGNPKVAASPRDIVYTMSADVAGNGAEPQPFAKTDLRCVPAQAAWHKQCISAPDPLV